MNLDNALQNQMSRQAYIKGGIIVSIERLKEIKKEFAIKYNDIRHKEFLTEINEGYGLIQQFMICTINELIDLKQQLAKKENAIDIGDVIKEARLRNG